jgi:hypothetical protein
MGSRGSGRLVGCSHRAPQLRQCVASGQRANQERVTAHRVLNEPERERQVVDGVECSDRQREIKGSRSRLPCVLDDHRSG